MIQSLPRLEYLSASGKSHLRDIEIAVIVLWKTSTLLQAITIMISINTMSVLVPKFMWRLVIYSIVTNSDTTPLFRHIFSRALSAGYTKLASNWPEDGVTADETAFWWTTLADDGQTTQSQDLCNFTIFFFIATL